MTSTIPYSLVLLGILLTTSLAALGNDSADSNPCFPANTCDECLKIKLNTPATNESTGFCVFASSRTGPRCMPHVDISEDIIRIVTHADGCKDLPPSNTTTTTPAPSPTPVPGPNTTTTTAPTTTTTPGPNTTTTTIPTTTPPPNSTTTTTTTIAPPTNGTTPATTTKPSNGTTPTPPTPTPTPTPRKGGGFAWGEFIGGIVFAIALSSLAYLIWRFYKARLDRNYHTFSNPTF